MQPWKVYALSGEARQRVIDGVRAKLEAEPDADESQFFGYPPKLHEPFRTRRFAVGEMLYRALGVPREDKVARRAHVARNFEFFGAPVGLFFAIDERFGAPQHGHLGMFMMSIALVAESYGLGTCMQEYWQQVQGTVAGLLGLPPSEKLISGMALGYPDEAAAVNQIRTPRDPVDVFARFEGFDAAKERPDLTALGLPDAEERPEPEPRPALHVR
jgi:nitroreductase